MKQSQAMQRLKGMVAHDQIPELSDADLVDLLRRSRSVDSQGNTIEDVTVWEPDTSYEVGDKVVFDDFVFTCVESGVSGDVSTWNQDENLTDGSVIWSVVGRSNWTPTYDVNYAAMLGWELKAAKAVAMMSFTADGVTFHRDQFLANCKTLQEMYSKKVFASIPLDNS